MYTRIRPLLEKQGITVVGTRTEDEKPTLTQRCEVSNEAQADLFLSLHSNAESNHGWGLAKGLLIITSQGPATERRNVAAKALLKRFREADVEICGDGLSHNARLTVLRKTDAPACLIEYGFHTNQEDVELLKTASYRDKLALATAQGACDFLGIVFQEDDEPSEMTDVADWAVTAWKKANEKGILDGSRPADPLSRQELAVILERLNLI